LKAFGAGSPSSVSNGVARADVREGHYWQSVERPARTPFCVTLAIPRFRLLPEIEVAHDFRDMLLSATLVTLDASSMRGEARQSVRAMLASLDASLYVVVDADGPFLPGDVPSLIREVRSGEALVARGMVWRASPPTRQVLPRSLRWRARLVVDHILLAPHRAVLSGLFLIERFGRAAEGE